mmetsp:Transcript_43477/g.74192  ORF Transcript_43477/g.74192 Transcript_43477/m.74192 type:complete len:245 (-) Transcript_43477:814-1548(-)
MILANFPIFLQVGLLALVFERASIKSGGFFFVRNSVRSSLRFRMDCFSLRFRMDQMIVLVDVVRLDQYATTIVRLTLPRMIHGAILLLLQIGKAAQVMLAERRAVANALERLNAVPGARRLEQLDVLQVQHAVVTVRGVRFRRLGHHVGHFEIGNHVLARGVGEAVGIGLGDAGTQGGILLEAAVVSVAVGEAGLPALGGAQRPFRAGLKNVLGEFEEFLLGHWFELRGRAEGGFAFAVLVLFV